MFARAFAAIALLGAVGTPAAAQASADFATRSDRTYCATSEGESNFLLVCWRPRDGDALTMGGDGPLRWPA